MKLPICWLKDFVDIGGASPIAVADALLSIGFEVEEIICAGESIENVVTAKVVECVRHENSDHLHKCKVDAGGRLLDIVCGAPNVKTGVIVPCALAGAKLPGGITIKEGEIRGVKSCGMLCSGKELGVDNSVIDGAETDGLLILPEGTETGVDIRKILGLDEYVLDVSVTANRPDCQSVAGLAREVAAVMGLKYNPPKTSYKKYASTAYMPTVEINAEDVCSRYTGRLITDIKIEKSPKWMRDRLRLAGLRPINNIVDITNFVLLEIGQPLHAFDIRYIDKGIVVRKAFGGEAIALLNGEKYELAPDMLVIADKSKPLAVAGVMGGGHSGIKDDTNCVFLEAARFERSSIRRTSKKLGLRSDSSARYEKGVDYLSVDTGRERALALIDMLGAGRIFDAASDAGIARPTEKVIVTTAKQISDIIGITIKQTDVVRILRSLEFMVTEDGKRLSCTVPLFREDVEDFADLAEEVIRYYGYGNLKSTNLKNAKCTAGGVPDELKRIDGVKDLLCGLGIYEMMSYSFININAHDKLCLPASDPRRNVMRLNNPLSEDLAVMRTQLTHNMLSALSLNQNRGNDCVRLFELGKVFLPCGENMLPDERFHLCIGQCGAGEDFYSLKSAVNAVLKYFGADGKIGYSREPYLHSGIGADVFVDGSHIGAYGQAHPQLMENYNLTAKCFIAEIDLTLLLAAAKPVKTYSEISKYPSVKRDLAVTVGEAALVGDMMSDIKAAGGSLLEEVSLFDIYKGSQIGEGDKSVAFSLKFRSLEKTLKEEDVQSVIMRITDSLSGKYGAKLRQ